MNKKSLVEGLVVGLSALGISVGSALALDHGNSAGEPNWQPPPEIRALLGKSAPEFASDLRWVNSRPLTLSALRGHPVLIRFWFRNCEMCRNTAPLLDEIYDDYKAKGVVVVGIHHAKSALPDTEAEVAAAASQLGFRFPLAIDNDWKTLDRFWMHGQSRQFTSSSFLIDQRGTIVWGHPGGSLLKGSPAALSLQRELDKLVSNTSAK